MSEVPESIFIETFGNSPMNRVLDFLVTYEGFDYSMTQIAEYSEIGYATLKLFWKNLEENGIVKMTRKVGNAKMYKLNLDSPVVQKFWDFYWAVAKIKTDDYFRKEGLLQAAKKV
ncbi:MAG: hypothetical protein ABH829_00245 [archaeon]